VKRLLQQEYVYGYILIQMIGWFWFAIGGSHVSDRLPRPLASEHIIREETLQEGGDFD